MLFWVTSEKFDFLKKTTTSRETRKTSENLRNYSSHVQVIHNSYRAVSMMPWSHANK